MKRNKKYYKKLLKENLMNGLRNIVLILGIGILSALDCPEGMTNIVIEQEEFCIPNDFQYNQSTLQAFYYFETVSINGITAEADDWVGAFNGDICVGSRKWDTSQCGSGICDVPVFGSDGWPETEGYMNSGDFPTFKIYDASEDSYYDATPTENIAWTVSSINNNDALNGYIWGCTDIDACNYNADATMDDDSCLETDCAGECGGIAEFDICDVCDSDSSNDCVQDCNGDWGGTTELDECGVCGGDGSSCGECGNGACNPDACDEYPDCTGECGGSVVVDECGVCGGDGIADGECDCAGNITDCAGDCGGSAVVDNWCGCDGD